MVSGRPEEPGPVPVLSGAQRVVGSRDTRGRAAVAPAAVFPRAFGGGGRGPGEAVRGSGEGAGGSGRWPGAGVKVSAAACPGWGRCRVRPDPTLRCAPRWANSKVWAAVRRGGGSGKVGSLGLPRVKGVSAMALGQEGLNRDQTQLLWRAGSCTPRPSASCWCDFS